LLCFALLSDIVISDEGDDEFDFRLWCVETSLSEAGIKKLVSQEVTNKKALLLLGEVDIVACKLGVKLKLGEGLRELRPKKDVTTESSKPSGTAANEGDNTDNVQDNGAVILPEASSSSQLPKTQFSLDEVASFLAGNPIPQELQASMNTARGAQLPGVPNPTSEIDSVRQFQTPNLGLHGPQFQSAISCYNPSQRQPNLGVYNRPVPFLPPRYPVTSAYQPSTIPIYASAGRAIHARALQ
jgi:hypothetical protein